MKLVSISVLLLMFSIGQSQVKTDSLPALSLDDVVVTATRTPRMMGNLAIPVSIVNAKTLYQSGSLRLHDILAEQTGIQVIDNFGKGVQVQGLSSEYTLILIDGEPLIGRTGGVFDLSKISVRNIRKIEIVKGPSSSLYGSEAMGGVINIITDRAGQNKTDIGLRYARFNTVDGILNFSRTFNKTDIQASSSYNRSEGYSLKPNAIQKTVEPYWKAANQLRIGYQIAPEWKAGVGIRSNITHIDNTILVQNVGSTILSKGYERNEEYNITPYLQYSKNNRFKSALRGYLTGFDAVQQLQAAGQKEGYDDRFKQGFSRLETQNDWQINAAATLTAGGGYARETVSSNRYDSLSTLRKNNIAYFFTQHEQTINKQVKVIAGLRYDDNQSYASVWSPKLAVQFKPSQRFDFNMSYGRGFKAPDFRQLYLNFTNLAAGAYSVFGTQVAAAELQRLENAQLIDQVTSMASRLADLKPEVSGGFNAGMKYRSEKGFQLSLNIFRNDLSNMIVTDIIAYKKSGGQVYSYFNLNRALTEGIEVDMDRRFGKYFAVKAGYQYLYSADKDILEAIRKGEVFQRELGQGGVSRMRISDYGGLPNRSRHAANLKITYERPSGHFATIRTLYRSRWGTADADGNGLINRADEFANGFVQVNCSAGLPLGTSWKLMAGVDNIFNYKDIQFLPGNPGRMGYIDIQFNF